MANCILSKGNVIPKSDGTKSQSSHFFLMRIVVVYPSEIFPLPSLHKHLKSQCIDKGLDTT